MYLFIVLDFTEFTVQHVTLVTFDYVCFKQQRHVLIFIDTIRYARGISQPVVVLCVDIDIKS